MKEKLKKLFLTVKTDWDFFGGWWWWWCVCVWEGGGGQNLEKVWVFFNGKGAYKQPLRY